MILPRRREAADPFSKQASRPSSGRMFGKHGHPAVCHFILSRSRICMKYRCPTCGYIYDDEKQDVKFADLPDDWCCPVCGEPKSEFVPMDD